MLGNASRRSPSSIPRLDFAENKGVTRNDVSARRTFGRGGLEVGADGIRERMASSSRPVAAHAGRLHPARPEAIQG